MGKTVSVDKFLKKLQRDISKGLKKNLALRVMLTEQEAIDEEVYNTYDPIKYKRRKDDGGLRDIDNMRVIEVSSKKIEIVNETKPKNGYPNSNNIKNLSELIEYGNGYKEMYYDFNGKFTDSRPFTTKTIDTLQRTHTLSVEMKNYLTKECGYSVVDTKLE